MISYKIMSVNAPELRMQVRYSKEDKPDYFVNVGLTDDFTANDVHNFAKTEVVHAERYWQRMHETFTLDTDTGVCQRQIALHCSAARDSCCSGSSSGLNSNPLRRSRLSKPSLPGRCRAPTAAKTLSLARWRSSDSSMRWLRALMPYSIK